MNYTNANFEVGTFYGKSFGNKIGEFVAQDGGISHNAGVKAKLANNPENESIFIINGDFLITSNFSIESEFFYSKYRVKTGQITLQESDGTTRNFIFPKFNTTLYALSPFFIVKHQFNNLTPFLGLGYGVGIGVIDNTKFSPNPFEYGVGGKKTDLFMRGVAIKVGVLYDVWSKFSIGLHYGYKNFKISDTNQQFRSFNTGFNGSLTTNYLAFGFKYKINKGF